MGVQFLNIYSHVNDINEAFKKYKRKRYKRKWTEWINPFISTEASMFYIITAVSFIPLQIFIDMMGIHLFSFLKCYIVSILFNFLVFIIITNIIAFILIRSADKKDLLSIWILSGLKEQLEVEQNNLKKHNEIEQET